MATAAVQTASHNRVEPGSSQLHQAEYPLTKLPGEDDWNSIASAWVENLNQALSTRKSTTIEELFLKEACWRDQLALSWDYHTFSGPESIKSFLEASQDGSKITSIKVDHSKPDLGPQVAPVDFQGKVKGIMAFLSIVTKVGNGRGVLRLLQDEQGKWKAFTLFTAMHELKGHEERIGLNRPNGVDHGGQPGRKNWLERRQATENFEGDLEPTVLIIGAGQGGLMCAARLRMLGIPALIVDRNPRIGDNWRNRYHQLVLHDPVWYDHMPYLPFPKTWPVFTPKDKLADWFESYAKLLELNCWTSTNITSAVWDEHGRNWTIELDRKTSNGVLERRTLHPRHIIQATGHSGEMNMPAIKGLAGFQGDGLYHSSQFKGARANSKNKRAVVVGCCNSGHDIAQDFYENGYDTTIIQRSSTYVMSSKEGIDVLLGGLYDESGPETEDADLLFMSYPNQMLKRLHLDATKEITRRDEGLLTGLTKAGFKLDQGPDDAGFFMKYFQRGGGYYIDVGASQLIIDGKIKVKQGHEITEVKPRGLLLDDGTELEADEIVFATGYQNMRGTSRKIFGDQIADKLKDVWGFDEEGELRTMWRRTGHPGFWFFGGNLALSRYYSKMLALQIKALEEGIMRYEDS